MKRIALLLLVVASAAVYAQKPVKPNLNKALASLNEGKIDEAKTNIDAAITNEKMMNDPKTWYYRGLIYASIDTTSKEQFASLDPNAFNVALESFKKADELSKGKGLFTTTADGNIQDKGTQMTYWAYAYQREGAKHYDVEDYKSAAESFERFAQILPDDTTGYLFGGYAAYSAEDFDKSIGFFEKFLEKGGKSSDAYALMSNMYSGPKQNKEKALEIMKVARQKFPNNPDFPKVEIGLLIDLKRVAEAKTGLEDAIKREPNNAMLHFYLGYVNASLNNTEAAKKSYEDAVRIDPKYFEAQFYLAKLMYADAAAIKKEMADLGITAADKKRRFELDKVLVDKLKVALPYWEKAEKIKPDDQETLDALMSIYSDLDMQDQAKRIEKRYKELGIE